MNPGPKEIAKMISKDKELVMKKSALLLLLFSLGLAACGNSVGDRFVIYLAHDFTSNQPSPYSPHCTVLQVESDGQVGEISQDSTPTDAVHLLGTHGELKPVTARCFEYVTQSDGMRVKTLTGKTVISGTERRNPTVYVGSSENVPANVVAKFKAQPNVTTSGTYPIVQFR